MKHPNLSEIIWIKTLSLVSITTLSACTPVQPSSLPSPPIEPAVINQAQPQPILKKNIPAQAKFTTKLHKISQNGVNFNIVSFDSRDFNLEIADQPNGPGSLWSDAATVAEKKNALAAINAGFFTPEGKPLGLVIDSGVKRGAYNPSSLGNGIYYTNASGSKLKRSSSWKTILKTNPKHLLQAGPMLVHSGNSTKGLSTQNSRPRSFLATDAKNHWIIGHANSCTLSELGTALDNLKIDDFTIVSALNLDGGRSSDLWVSEKITNGPLTIRPFWNKSVRNFLILKRK